MNFRQHLGVISHKELYVKDGQYYTDGGFPRQMEALKKLFQQVTICAPVRKGRPPDGLENLSAKGLSVYPLPYMPTASVLNKLMFLMGCPYLIWRMWRFSGQVDIVQVRIPNYVGVLGALVMRWQRKPTFVWLGGNWWERILAGGRGFCRRMGAAFIRWLLPHLIRRNWLVFVLDPGMAKQTGLKNTCVFVVSTTTWAHELPAQVPLPRDNPFLSLLYVGRLSAEKGPQRLIEALRNLSGVSWRLTVVGDGPLRGELETLAHRWHVADRVYFIGRVPRDQVVQFYRKADVLVVPSLSETFPKVIQEGMSHGLAVVASRVGAIPQLLADGRGILVEPGNPDDLAEAIRALADDRSRLQTLSQRGLEFARHYTLDKLNVIMSQALQSHFGLEIEQ